MTKKEIINELKKNEKEYKNLMDFCAEKFGVDSVEYATYSARWFAVWEILEKIEEA